MSQWLFICTYQKLQDHSNHIHIVIVNITLLRELDVSVEPEDLADEPEEDTDSSDLLPEEEEILNRTSTEDFLKQPGPEEEEKERKEREATKEHEKRALKMQVENAQTEAVTEQMRRLKEDLKRNAEINKKMAAQLEKTLKTEDIKEIIQNEEFLNEVESSTRHQEFHSGSSKKKEKLQYRNFIHVIKRHQEDEIRFHLKERFKSHSEEYIDAVLIGETILRLYCRAHNLTREAAEEKLLNTGMDFETGSEEEEEPKRKKKEGARKKKQKKAEEKENQLKPGEKKVFKVFKEEESKKKQKEAEEKEKQPKAGEKKVFKFKLENTQEKKRVEEERGKRDKMVSKKQKAKTVKSTIEDRRAEEERRQPRRLEPEQPAQVPLSEGAILGRADAVASVFVDEMLGIRSSRTHNP